MFIMSLSDICYIKKKKKPNLGFGPWDPSGGRRELTPTSYPLTFTPMLCCVLYIYTHTGWRDGRLSALEHALLFQRPLWFLALTSGDS